MPGKLIENQIFEAKDYRETALPLAVYEECVFNSCNFDQADLSNQVFIDCQFKTCNLNVIKAGNTTFQETQFSECNLTGAKFDQVNPTLLSFHFIDCKLELASFHGLKIPNAVFEKCDLREVDFSYATLTGAKFKESNLQQAIFMNTLLENADVSTTENVQIDPEENYIDRLKVSALQLPGLLSKYNLEIQ